MILIKPQTTMVIPWAVSLLSVVHCQCQMTLIKIPGTNRLILMKILFAIRSCRCQIQGLPQQLGKGPLLWRALASVLPRLRAAGDANLNASDDKQLSQSPVLKLMTSLSLWRQRTLPRPGLTVRFKHVTANLL
jgi:hypothetical protein